MLKVNVQEEIKTGYKQFMLSYGIRWVCARTATLNWSRVGRSTIYLLTPIHESSAFQLFIFHIYILSFSFFVIIRNANIAHLEKVKSINECMCTSNLLDYYLLTFSIC